MQAPFDHASQAWWSPSVGFHAHAMAGWHGAPSDYLTMYSIMKGMESMAITDLNGVNWYREFCDQLKAEQNADGSWPSSTYEQEPVGAAGINSTEWALLVLERAAPPPEIVQKRGW